MRNPPQRRQPSTRNLPKRNQPPTRNPSNDINRPTHTPPKRRQPPTRNPPKRNRRGGADVPARTSAQRRCQTKNIRIVRGDFNDGSALAGRHGRAHRHRPYQTPLYIHAQSSPTTSTTQTKRVNNLHTHRGRKCIAHSRPHS